METSENGHAMLAVILRFFQEDHWSYQKIENKPIVRAGYHGERGTWVCFARADEENERLTFHAVMGLNIPAEYRLQAAEYLIRVNYGLPVGNFDMNLDTGDIRFRTSIETPGSAITVEMVRAMAYTTVRSMDTYFPGVIAVVHAGLSPEAALARIESEGVFE